VAYNRSVPPSVSVVITSYNRSHLLPRAIESAQCAGKNLEVIVVDDCSSDDTPEVCAQIPDIRYVRLSANPIITTSVGGSPDLLMPDAGILVPPGDSAALAEAMQRLASDPALRKRIGQAARAVSQTVRAQRGAFRVGEYLLACRR
jgi:hypothetical protein